MLSQDFDWSIFDEEWTLFLDRDGVINKKIDGYVSEIDEFSFTENAPQVIAEMNEYFFRTFVVTNQQGISKGLMTEEQLNVVHQHMVKGIHAKGGYIDRVYFCGDLAGTGSTGRKPATGMGLQAKAEFPDISFRKGIMLGDSPGDMLFAKNLGMIGIFISSEAACPGTHLVVPSLAQFWQLFKQGKGI